MLLLSVQNRINVSSSVCDSTPPSVKVLLKGRVGVERGGGRQGLKQMRAAPELAARRSSWTGPCTVQVLCFAAPTSFLKAQQQARHDNVKRGLTRRGRSALPGSPP